MSSLLLRDLRMVANGEISPAQNFLFNEGSLIPYYGVFSSWSGKTINCQGFLGSKGWIDLRCGIGEPGLEYRETVESLCESLMVSGFSKAVVMPNTDPVIQTKNEVDFLLSKSSKYSPCLEIMGAVTKNTLGEDFTEILDVHYQSGVRVFGEGVKPLSNSDRYMKALQYLQRFDGILFDYAYDPLLGIFGQMHEGEVSTQLGMKGIPNLAEDVAIQRNLEILRYAGGRVHFQTVSTSKGADLIRKAKAEGLKVTADVSIYQLIFSDSDLVHFDSNFKVKPPFRGQDDREALIEALKDGTIDAIVSNHQPKGFDDKFSEFDLASFGMSGLQSFLPAMVQLVPELGWELLIDKITNGPEKIVGSVDSWTIWNPEENWQYTDKSNRSLSSNHPWFGKELKGKVKLVIQKGKLIQIDE